MISHPYVLDSEAPDVSNLVSEIIHSTEIIFQKNDYEIEIGGLVNFLNFAWQNQEIRLLGNRILYPLLS